MDFFEVLKQRHSIRVFSEDPVEPEKLAQLLEAARSAPSAANVQAYEIFVVTKVRQRAALSQAASAQGFVLTAPVSLIFCADPARSKAMLGARGARLYAVQDATIACAYAQLAATAAGLASVWVGAFEEDAVRRAAGIPEHLRPVSILPLGYPAGEPEIKPRRPLDELVHY